MKQLTLQRDASCSLVDQIVTHYRLAIITKSIPNGFRLPAERTLAQTLGIARGTVHKAYQVLVSQALVEVRHQDGYYVIHLPQLMGSATKKLALDIIDQAFDKLRATGLNDTEIMNLIKLKLPATQCTENINLLIVSNNHLILQKIEMELSYLTRKSFCLFTLSFLTLNNIRLSKNPHDLLMTYDLIITTIIDHDELLRLVPLHNHKLFRANIAPTNATLMLLKALPRYSRFTIIYRTAMFKQLVIETLTSLNFKRQNLFPVHELNYNPKNHSINDINAIVNFNESPLYTNPDFQERNLDFLNNGGKIIHYEYMLTRTALSAIEERIHSIQEKR